MNHPNSNTHHHSFIKYCGFRRLCDALYATSLGIDALGFVFYEKSARYIAPQQAASIIRHLKSIRHIKHSNINPPQHIGLFVNHDKQAVLQIAEQTKIDVLQFHGNESPEFCEELSAQLNLPYIRAIAINHASSQLWQMADYEKLLQEYPNACAFLLDKKSEQHGGSGQKFNWQVVDAELWRQNPPFIAVRRMSSIQSIQSTQQKAHLILAGGIFLDDISKLKALKINSIDLSTGLEVATSAAITTPIDASIDCKGFKSQRLMYEIIKKLT